MKTFDTITAAKTGIMEFMISHSTSIPSYMTPKFFELMNSPSAVDEIVGVGELIWANRAKLTEPAWELGAGLIGFATFPNAWHGLAQDGRGDAIVANFRKDLGEIKQAPAAPEARQGSFIEEPSDTPATPPPPPPTTGTEE